MLCFPDSNSYLPERVTTLIIHTLFSPRHTGAQLSHDAFCYVYNKLGQQRRVKQMLSRPLNISMQCKDDFSASILWGAFAFRTSDFFFFNILILVLFFKLRRLCISDNTIFLIYKFLYFELDISYICIIHNEFV